MFRSSLEFSLPAWVSFLIAAFTWGVHLYFSTLYLQWLHLSCPGLLSILIEFSFTPNILTWNANMHMLCWPDKLCSVNIMKYYIMMTYILHVFRAVLFEVVTWVCSFTVMWYLHNYCLYLIIFCQAINLMILLKCKFWWRRKISTWKEHCQEKHR